MNTVEIFIEKNNNIGIVGYEILCQCKNSSLLKRVAVIPNDNTITPVLITRELEIPKAYSNSFYKIIKIKNEVVFNDEHDITIYINDKEVDKQLYGFNKESNELDIIANVRDDDRIKASYYVNGIKKTIKTNISGEYHIKPLIDTYNNNIGVSTLFYKEQ